MIVLSPATLRGYGVALEPLAYEHARELEAAARDGELWNLAYTSVPAPGEVTSYIDAALAGQREGEMLAWAVRDERDGRIVGSTRYHDILPAIDRVEIGYTWYARSVWSTHVNPACKLLLLEFAFDRAGCAVVGLRTDGENARSQRAIARLGARRDGSIRHWGMRRDGRARDTVMFSILHDEWPGVRRGLEMRVAEAVR